jgi:hypothetical protein
VPDADIYVRLDFDGRELAGYAVILRIHEHDRVRSVRLFDYVQAHGEHHMHRYTLSGEKQQPPTVLAHASVQAGFDAAIGQIRQSGSEVIEAWRRQTT